MFNNRKFRFSQEITVLSIAAALLCYSLSYWQYTRYVGKKVYLATVAERENLGIRQFEVETEDWDNLFHAKVRVSGVFDHEREVVLTNRSKDDAPGVKLVTPLKIEGTDTHVLVDRGFLPYKIYASGDVPDHHPAGVLTVEGLIRPSQAKSFFLAPPVSDPIPGQWRERWIRLETDKMAKQLPYPVLPIYIEQVNQAEGYPEHDAKAVVSPGRHMNYTIQWASFGTFSWLFGLFLQLRPQRKKSADPA